MQDHRYLCLQSAYQTWSNAFLTVFSPAAKSSSNLCRHKLIRSAEIRKQRTVSNTLVFNPPTWYAAAQVKYQTHTFHPSPSKSASNGLLAYRVQHLNYSWIWRERRPQSIVTRKKKKKTCLELHYLLMSRHTYGLRESNQKSSREESREESPAPPPPSPLFAVVLPRLAPPLTLSPPQISICGDEWHIYFSTKVVCM